MYRIHEIKLKLGEPLDRLPGKIIKKIGVRGLTIGDWRVVKESIDARDKKNIFMVYSVDFEAQKVTLNPNPKIKLEIAPDLTYKAAVSAEGAVSMKHRPVIVGFGPA